jgi:CubicO group peptidase (beta-lactamase class C family)
MVIAENIKRFIDDAVAREEIVGTVVLVHKNGQPIVQHAAGLADREAGKPVTLDSIFRYASCTKPFVAATCLAMVEHGMFGLDDLAKTYIPWFHPKTPDGKEAAITIRHLLTHTSGLSYDPALERLPQDRAVNLGLENTDLNFEDNFSRYNDIPLAFVPGTRWQYSCSIDVLGAVIAARHGDSLQSAIDHYVNSKLGIVDTGFSVRDESRLTVPYADGTPRPVRMSDPCPVGSEAFGQTVFSPSRIHNPKAYQSGGAGMAGTAGDMLKLLEALANDGGPILSKATVDAGLSNQIGNLEMTEAHSGMRFGFFSAVIENPDAANTILPVGALQWGGVYGNTWFVDRKNGLSVVSFTNTAMNACVGEYPEQLRRAIYKALA